jgi:phospho-N-acetylmuramoyl-pentapeptide-transferase
MLYYLFKYLDRYLDFPGAGVFQYISFRAGMAIILSLIISAFFGKRLIQMLRRLQVGETVRDLGLEGQLEKAGTPTMGGIIILGSILLPVLLFARIDNIYVLLMLTSTVGLGLIGFLDDYIKVFKKNKQGLAGRFKIIGQVAIGMLVGTVLYFHPDVTMRRKIVDRRVSTEQTQNRSTTDSKYVDVNSQITTIPFVKNHEFNYSKLLSFMGDGYEKYGWLIFIPVCIFIITAVSNGANITDGIDGLATGTSAIIGTVLGVFAYISGNAIFSDYLNVMYIPNSGELVVFTAAFVGACIGFLWYNAYPAQVFMGDTGSLALGGIIATLSICIRKELLIPILCGIFLVENLSVMMQVSYFKYTKKKYGEGRRIFKMSPLHHHYQKLGMHESKIVSRFWIVGIGLAVFTLITLKLR